MKILEAYSRMGNSLNLFTVDENDQITIHSYRKIYSCASGNTLTHYPCLQADAVNESSHNSSVMNGGDVAW